ncbi:MAG TPA: CYTH domain-containing protein [Gammaproteobacteria bacterium]|nr:CYTH domain-containing protein [Gammaproteobacteria bacterium]
MGREIERKFLVSGDAWRAEAAERAPMSQGYIARSDRNSVRVRLAGERAWLNIKSGGLVASRHEFEYAIPPADARELLDLAIGPLIVKTRHLVPFGGFEWEVDEFHGANQGLVVAEIELDDERQEFPRPAWIGAEVTHLERYYNVKLVKHPYSEWTETERRGA